MVTALVHQITASPSQIQALKEDAKHKAKVSTQAQRALNGFQKQGLADNPWALPLSLNVYSDDICQTDNGSQELIPLQVAVQSWRYAAQPLAAVRGHIREALWRQLQKQLLRGLLYLHI